MVVKTLLDTQVQAWVLFLSPAAGNGPHAWGPDFVRGTWMQFLAPALDLAQLCCCGHLDSEPVGEPQSLSLTPSFLPLSPLPPFFYLLLSVPFKTNLESILVQAC